ncbi:apolipoprotein N-acyltransferase [Gammaproteobacteria bacterium 42_54_T18]|nr:apolipoprotein N-acyltransferase [Gammaproteobacteria bacterium 42_54_T18]
MLPALLIPCLVLSYGWLRLPASESTNTTKNDAISIGYIQPNTTGKDKLSALILHSKRLLELKNNNIDLIVWPEVPTSFSWADSSYDRYRIQRYINEIDSHLILVSGYRYVNNKNASSGFYNTAHFISPKGIQLSQYNKQHLVPFFEYLPFKNTIPWIKQWFPGSRNYLPGTTPKIFEFNNRYRLAPLICYEILFSDLVRNYKDLGATIIINPSNDGWFGAQGALSHLSIAMFRTVEYHIPLVRVGNTGISTVISAHGKISKNDSIPVNQTGENVAHVSASSDTTIYLLFGKWVHHITILVFLLLLVIDRPMNRT